MMIAIAHDRVESVHDRFVAMLPAIKQRAYRAFRDQQPEVREELVQEVIANAYVAFARLVKLDKANLAFATPLASYAIRQVIAGRRVGSRLNICDVMSPANHRVVVERLSRCDRQDGGWREVLVEDRHAGPAETAAARLDMGSWLRSLSSRNRKIAKALAKGEKTSAVARMFGVTAARVSQLRRELEAAWQAFQGEPVAA